MANKRRGGETVELKVDLDKTCSTCGKHGTLPSGLCMECAAAKVARVDRVDTIERELFVDLTSDEVKQRGESLAVLLQEIDGDKAEAKEAAKEAKTAIARKELHARELAGTVRSRRELRMVPVDVINVGDGKVNEVRQDTGEVTTTRLMTERERQQTLPRIGEAAVADAATT